MQSLLSAIVVESVIQGLDIHPVHSLSMSNAEYFLITQNDWKGQILPLFIIFLYTIIVLGQLLFYVAHFLY